MGGRIYGGSDLWAGCLVFMGGPYEQVPAILLLTVALLALSSNLASNSSLISTF